MKEESQENFENTGAIDSQLIFADVETKQTSINSNKTSVKQEHSLHNKSDAKPSHSGSFSWPSLWKNGPRRSAFQPYKPRRESNAVVGPTSSDSDTASVALLQSRPASTVMTNLQRGNMPADSHVVTPYSLSWFTLAGRGDITLQELQQMIDQGKDIDCVDSDGLSALMWAAFHGQSHTAQILLEAGAAAGRRGEQGQTPLMLAATEGHLEIVRLLITAGADVNNEDHNGSTALMCAVAGDHPHTVNELLANGADMWVHNNQDSTAYDIAVDKRCLRSKAVLEKYIASLITGS